MTSKRTAGVVVYYALYPGRLGKRGVSEEEEK
jgi:hypothetical protein